MIDRLDEATTRRMLLALFGLLAGLGLYLLDEYSDVLSTLFMILAGTALFAWAYSALALTGPLRAKYAILYGVGMAVLAAALIYLNFIGSDYENPSYSASSGIGAMTIMVLLAPPFVIALHRRVGIDHYPTLFTESWEIFVRGAAALLFLGVFWALLYLCDALFKLINLTVIEDVIDIDVVPFILSGAVFGLAVAVAHDLRSAISPHIFLRLKRLLVWPILVAVLIFTIGLLVTGLDGFVGGFSAAGTLFAVAAVIASLVTGAVDIDEGEEVQSGIMRLGTRALSLTILVVAALAFFAIWLRVSEYGLTPARILAMICAAIVIVYGGAYFWAAIRPGAWTARIRQMNVYLALGVIGMCVFWQLPLLNAERLSVNNQIERYLDGKMEASELPWWDMKTDWGYAGLAGLKRLEGLDGEAHAELAPLISGLENGTDMVANLQALSTAPDKEIILSLLRVLPEDSALNEAEIAAALSDISVANAKAIAEGCKMLTEQQNPGCFALRLPAWHDPNVSRLNVYYRLDDRIEGYPHTVSGLQALTDIDRVIDQAFSLGVRRSFELKIGDTFFDRFSVYWTPAEIQQ